MFLPSLGVTGNLPPTPLFCYNHSTLRKTFRSTSPRIFTPHQGILYVTFGVVQSVRARTGVIQNLVTLTAVRFTSRQTTSK